MMESLMLCVVVLCAMLLCWYIDIQHVGFCRGGVIAKDNTVAYRGFAIILIMICHVTGEWAFRPFTPLGGVGVAMFLFLSGFGLNESCKKSGLDRFWKKKLLRLWLPYVVFRGIIVMIEGCDNIGSLVLDLICWKSHYWYIDYMVRCYIVFWLGTKFFVKYKWIIFAVFALYTFWTMDALRAEQALSFLMGVVCSAQVEKVNGWSRRTLFVIMSLALLFGMCCLALKQLPAIRNLMNTHYYSVVELGIKLPLGIAMMIMTYLAPMRLLRSPLLSFCGTYSLELYLVHMYFVPRVVDCHWYQGVAALVASGIVAYGFSKFMNKITIALK